jgi:hypothetical protein
MEIVYFSADGTASAGRDGISGSKLGSIDFVYDHGGSIVTVKESTDTETEDYQYYYASLCLVYTDLTQTADGAFLKVSDARIRVRRYVGLPDPDAVTQTSILAVDVASAAPEDTARIKCVRYSYQGDTVVRTDGTRE